ncbi:divergent polysaccharide deacetylase family protein [Malonomonas rubra]|uniref:divergent polysaccharide deacetylase family protein n=1 Tax=Malonomonas rubra TaxID=57040 RepID=UPI0026EDA0DE|nr:divergent polysaccharide deacetylase family protein [Malonomonas rubra]
MALASVFLLAFVGVCLLALGSLRSWLLSDVSHYEEPTAIKPQPAEQIYDYQQIYKLVESELLSGPQSQGWQKLPVEKNLQRMKMFGDFPDHNRLLDLSARIAETGAPAQLDLLPRMGCVRLYWKKELHLELRYRVPIEVTSSRPRIAIVMDDMGRSLKTFRALLDLDLMVTPAIIPETHSATEAALLFQKAGREYLIHMPMQPINYPSINPGKNALLLGQTETETRRLVRHYMDRVPGAVGGNNHMGSGFTQNRAAMRIVLDELQQAALFFIDSKTIGNSVAYDEARRMKVPTASRNIFLDNEENIAYIRKQIRKMVRMSDERGELVAICHPYSETLEALRLELPWLRQQQVDFVPASTLVKVY